MNLYEFEGKNLLQQFNIPIPKGAMIYRPDSPAPIPYPFVLKAQVMTGGRGKAGGVRVCRNEAEYRRNASEILALSIKGHKVQALLCEELISAEQEFYASITLQGVNKPTLILSAAGGVEIEEVAKNAPEKILRLEFDPFSGLNPYQLAYIAKFMSAAAGKEAVTEFLLLLQRAFFGTGATLVEINPLGARAGKLLAMDAKVVLDEHASEMKETMAQIEQGRERFAAFAPKEKENTTITYISLEEGDIGLISDGAGTGMLTLDLITEAGGKVASFCELGGTTPAEVMYRAMQYTLENSRPIKTVMIVLIGGFNRMDDMANGITKYLLDHPSSIRIFTRMCGTMEEEGKRLMGEAGLTTYDDLTSTVAALMAATR